MLSIDSTPNRVEAWGYRLENTNPCRVVRLNRKRKNERFLSKDELTRVGKVLAENGWVRMLCGRLLPRRSR